MTSAALTTDDLLHGAAYAIEQAGCLIRDAVMLIDDRRAASALALAAFAREELGRSEILLDFRCEAAKTGPIPLDEVKRRCDDHLLKLSSGQQGASLRVTEQQGLRLMNLEATGDSLRAKEYSKSLSKAAGNKFARMPAEANSLRHQALYVDPSPVGEWNRPCMIDHAFARTFVDEVCSDYIMLLDRLEHVDMAVAEALRAWVECPRFPTPKRPRHVNDEGE